MYAQKQIAHYLSIQFSKLTVQYSVNVPDRGNPAEWQGIPTTRFWNHLPADTVKIQKTLKS